MAGELIGKSDQLLNRSVRTWEYGRSEVGSGSIAVFRLTNRGRDVKTSLGRILHALAEDIFHSYVTLCVWHSF